jgi:Ca-activated chloride channel family protein
LTLLAPWFLAGLAALAPLVALHLRRRRREQEVASLLLFRELPTRAAARRRRARLVLPLLLLLQALFLVLLVVALARPGAGGGSSPGGAGAAPAVFVLDGSTRMAMTDVPPSRLAAARTIVDRRLGALPADTPVSVVLATATPRLLATAVSPSAARSALARARADSPTADVPAALALAAGELHRPGGTITLVRAQGELAPRVRTSAVTYRAVTIGKPADNQGLTTPVARCANAAAGAVTCSVLTTVRNEASVAVRERLLVQRDGRTTASQLLTLAAGARADVVLAAPPGARLTLALTRPDALGADDRATVRVPGPGAPVAVALVSSRPGTAPLARALRAVPGVTLRRIAPGDYAQADARSAGLLVLDRWLPEGDLPPAPALLLVAPPRVPEGAVGAELSDPSPSGEQAASPLLTGVDLSGLAVDTGAARRITLPPALPALLWSRQGPLLAAGTPTRGHRVALLALDPQRSNLPQLPAFPVLIANLVAWSHDAATSESTVAAAAPRAPTVTLRATAGGAAEPGHRDDWWPYLAAAALLVLLAEWAYPWLAERRRRTVAP